MQVKDLLVTGNVRVLGNLYTKDGPVGGGSAGGGGGGGDSITYRLTKSGSTITLTGSDGSSSSVTDADTNTTYTLSSLGAAPASHTHTKAQITDFPTSMPPTAHTHTKSQITDFPTSMTPTAHTHTKSQITDFPTSMTPTAHTHTKSQITDFPSRLPASDVYDWAKAASKPSYGWSEITGKPSTFSPSSHNHSASEITSGTLAVARGGTGQTSIDGIKSALGIANLIASGCLIEEGTYTGTGGYGVNHKINLTFSFTPKMVFVYGASGDSVGFMVTTPNHTRGIAFANHSTYDIGYSTVSWSGNTITWYGMSTYTHMNSNGAIYKYVAIG